jgi:hypothetical protein
MKRNAMIGVGALAVLAFTMSLAAAAPGRGGRGCGDGGMGGGYRGMYNPATVETVTGTIESIDLSAPMKRMRRGTHLTLKTEKGSLSVRLGPEWYVERLDGKLANGDVVEVKGSRVTFDGNPAIIAAEVKKGDAVLKLRDEKGVPAWAGKRR